MSKKLDCFEIMNLGKGLFEICRGISENNYKSIDHTIVDPETGKRYHITIEEVKD